MPKKDLRLKDTIIFFDRDLGLSIFTNFSGYNDFLDDAEWLLERTSQRSCGFLLRPVSDGEREGVWIGEYNHKDNQITRDETLFDRNAALLSKLISDYASHKIGEKEIARRLNIDLLKKKIKSEIIQDFKYYTCPTDRFYKSCTNILEIYENLKGKYGGGGRIPYSLIVKEIANMEPCREVTICPIRVPNAFEKILNLNKALKSRRLGEIKFVDPGMVEIT